MKKVNTTLAGKTSKAKTAKKAAAAQEDARPAASLTDQAYSAIKDKILSLELRPGLFINAAQLCEMTGFSRMPVHQAIHRLQSEGLIEVIPRKGLVVRSDSLDDILHLLEARLVIEPTVVALAAERIGKPEIATLKKMLSESRKLRDQSQREAFAMIDRAFHSVIAESCGNHFLMDALKPLHDRSNMIWHLRVMPENGLVVTQDEHEAIFEAIVAQDVKAAREAMTAHLLSLRERLLKAAK